MTLNNENISLILRRFGGDCGFNNDSAQINDIYRIITMYSLSFKLYPVVNGEILHRLSTNKNVYNADFNNLRKQSCLMNCNMNGIAFGFPLIYDLFY